MITYNDIYEAARKEKYTEQLQPLNKTFTNEVSKYIKEKKDIASKQDENFSDVIMKTQKQLENAISLFRELMARRRKKILNLVLIAAETGISKQDFENMLPFEKDMFEDIMKCVDSADKKISGILSGNTGNQEKENDNDLVSFKEDVDEFLDGNGEKMGPFKKGQMANLPKEISKILIDGGKAEKVQE